MNLNMNFVWKTLHAKNIKYIFGLLWDSHTFIYRNLSLYFELVGYAYLIEQVQTQLGNKSKEFKYEFCNKIIRKIISELGF